MGGSHCLFIYSRTKWLSWYQTHWTTVTQCHQYQSHHCLSSTNYCLLLIVYADFLMTFFHDKQHTMSKQCSSQLFKWMSKGVFTATQLNSTQLSPMNKRSDPVDSVCRPWRHKQKHNWLGCTLFSTGSVELCRYKHPFRFRMKLSFSVQVYTKNNSPWSPAHMLRTMSCSAVVWSQSYLPSHSLINNLIVCNKSCYCFIINRKLYNK